MIADLEDNTDALMVLDRVLHLVIQTKNQIKVSNKRNEDLDEGDLDKYIDKVAIE